jgi:hypothetical protein
MCRLLRWTAAVAPLLLAGTVAAQAVVLGITVDPPYPGTGDPIHLTAIGQSPLCSATLEAAVGAADSPGFAGTIHLGLGACPATPPPISLPFAQTVIVGPLPQGLYEVRSDDGGAIAELTVTDFHPEPINSLFLSHQRFEAKVTWHTATKQGIGLPEALTDSAGYFWFFDPSNPELLVKVIDGTPVNSHYWVFVGSLSDVAYTVTVTDRSTGAVRTYTNPAGTVASRTDTSAF